MIREVTFRVNTTELLPPERAYAFYSCLLSLLPGEYATELHEQKETPVSQCLYREKAETLWRIQLLDETVDNEFSPILRELKTLPLNSGEIGVEQIAEEKTTAEELIEKARKIESDRFFSLRFVSPTAFKQSGRYTVLPEKELILQSLLNKWNTVFPSYSLTDEEAFQMLAEGIRISDYNLRTTRFLLKENKIPGFIGNLRVEARLSAPMLDLWKILFSFSEYSGIGIKTALGMGGVKLNMLK